MRWNRSADTAPVERFIQLAGSGNPPVAAAAGLEASAKASSSSLSEAFMTES